jgi:hypothetical protein
VDVDDNCHSSHKHGRLLEDVISWDISFVQVAPAAAVPCAAAQTLVSGSAFADRVVVAGRPIRMLLQQYLSEAKGGVTSDQLRQMRLGLPPSLHPYVADEVSKFRREGVVLLMTIGHSHTP